jgi:DNA processing protein
MGPILSGPEFLSYPVGRLSTVVVEASATSGAKSQARRALEHGKHLFLLESLVRQEEWARRYADHPAATVIADAAQITAVLAAAPRGG